MVKGLTKLILLEAAAKRKMESCRKKIKEMGRGLSPSSEDSSLEDLHNVETVKEEPKEEYFCPECGEGGVPEIGANCAKCKGKVAGVKEEVKDKEAVPGGNMVVQAVAEGWQGPGKGGEAALRTRNDNFYKVLKGSDGGRTYMCRKCFLNGEGTTSHSLDSLCAVGR